MEPLRAKAELVAGGKDFATGLLIDLVEALRHLAEGELLALRAPLEVTADLERWARFTGNAMVAATAENGEIRHVLRKGPLPADEPGLPIGSRVWLYANFDCNLACDYCCVRSSPRAARKALGLATIQRVAREAPSAGVRELFVTGGEPFLREDIGEVLFACAEALPTTVLTNGMLFEGKRREALRGLPRDRLILQISLDSPTAALHDAHRGVGAWDKARRGIAIARGEGFRVRLASTVNNEQAAEDFRLFLDGEGIAEEDRVIRRVALRGFAEEGVALTRADLVPEVTLTADGIWWHPVGATDDDFFVTGQPFPLTSAIEAVRLAWEEERRFATALASVFRCA